MKFTTTFRYTGDNRKAKQTALKALFKILRELRIANVNTGVSLMEPAAQVISFEPWNK